MLVYLTRAITEPASFPPGYSPAYSNNGFELLGIAMENMANSSLEAMFTESIVDRLGLRRTSYTTPNTTSNGVIPAGDPYSSGWNSDFGVLMP